MWQKFGKGPKYRGFYMYSDMKPSGKRERTFVLVHLRKNGNTHSVSAESPEMLKKVGWVKTS